MIRHVTDAETETQQREREREAQDPYGPIFTLERARPPDYRLNWSGLQTDYHVVLHLYSNS